MNILVENATNRVIHITDGTITLEADRTVTPERIYAPLNSSNATVYEGVTPPTNDNGRYTYDGSTFTDTWPYAELSRVQFLDALQNHGGVSDSDLVASRQDANLGAFWLKFELANSISRDDAKTVAGLDALIATGYLDSAGKQAVLDNWLRARP
jgi:hypothetical protein